MRLSLNWIEPVIVDTNTLEQGRISAIENQSQLRYNYSP